MLPPVAPDAYPEKFVKKEVQYNEEAFHPFGTI
jgi:hypothetical protein